MTPPLDLLPALLRGLSATLTILFGATVTAVACAFVAGLGRRSRWWVARKSAGLYIETFRGTSALVQLFWCYFALPIVGVELSAMTAAILVLGLNTGAYGAEVVRGAIQAVPKGQWEAAKALNFSRGQMFRLIIIPQAIPPVVPALGNYLVAMFKETPLLSAIAVLEVLQRAKIIGADTFRYLEPFTLAGVFFLVLSLGAAGLIRLVERKVAVRGA